jgi:hypothetical protein
MKSERRHQLQQNSLARSLENLPKMGRESGSKLLLGVVTVLLIIVLVRFYLNNRQQKRDQVAMQLANARVELTNLRGENMRPEANDKVATLRDKVFKDLDNAVEEVLQAASEPAEIAQARNIRGDAYLQMATVGQATGATTQPEQAGARKPGELLDEAARNYGQVLESRNGVPSTEIANAMFGLAAVAESRGEWDKARGQYDAIVADGSIPQAFHDYAQLRRSLLDNIKKPIVLGTPSTRPFERELSLTPTTTPAAVTPSTAPVTPVVPSTAPTTAPTTPATGPTTAPATGSPLLPTFPGPTTSPSTPTTSPIFNPLKL